MKCLEWSLQYVRNFSKLLNLIENLKAEEGIEPITFAMKRCDAMQTGVDSIIIYKDQGVLSQ